MYSVISYSPVLSPFVHSAHDTYLEAMAARDEFIARFGHRFPAVTITIGRTA